MNILPFRQSPNYTPNAQVRSAYGRARTIEFGAGHWWDAPERFPSFSGVVNTLMNPSRQASAHAVVGDNDVQPLVRPQDASWATGNANPFTVSIETDPQIIYRWRAGGDKAKANRIFETLAAYIAYMGWHNLPWKPHSAWMTTGCNPIPWGEVMQRAKEIAGAVAPPPVQDAEWKRNLVRYGSVVKKTIARDGVPLRNLAAPTQVIKTFQAGTVFDIGGETKVNGYLYYLTKYAVDNNTGQGVDEYEFVKPDTRPEWQKNLKDITPVKLTVLVAQTPLYNFADMSVIKQLGQGTVIDFVKTTTVGGVEYLLSSYSATAAMPNGIKRADVGVPAQPPVNEKPEWLKNWLDIVDVKMYARADTDLVDLTNGNTIKVIPRGTEIAVASTTEWHGQKYAITEYSTGKQLGQGIRIDDLDMKPVGNDKPTEPAPEQPVTNPDANAVKAFLQMLVGLIQAFLAKLK